MEIVKTFEKVNNLKLNYTIGPRRPGDVVAVYADTSYANRELGWKAEKTTEETLRSAWLWEKKVRGID
jgi:UDP-glucose 4-epimerase